MKYLARTLLFCASISAWSHSALASGSEFDSIVDRKKAPLFSAEAIAIEDRGYSPFWVCGELASAHLKLKCDDLGYNPLEGQKAELQIEANTEQAKHEYGLRHGILTTECRSLRKSIQKLAERSKKFCILGDFAGMDPAATYGWVFFEFKTERGSICDFCF
jgi:hypothetical protein